MTQEESICPFKGKEAQTMAQRTNSSKQKTIIVVDDHTLVRDAVVQMINFSEDLTVVAATSDGRELIGLVKEHRPDLIILDIELPNKNGLALTKEITSQYPKQKILLLTMHQNEEYAIRGLKAGACGFILKTTNGEGLLEAIRDVLKGETYISEDVSGRIAKHHVRFDGKLAHSNLSEREFQVLRGIAMGKSCQELSEEFDLNVKTIYTYRTRILEKLNLDPKNDISLLQYALRHSLLVGEHAPLPLGD